MEDANHITPFPAEVIELIFDQMEAKGRDSSLADFANLARSCRAFTELALDRLWRVQGNLTLLIRCMPEDLWNIQVDASGEEVELTFQRAIVETDWTRFEYYQWRVHEFGIGDDISGTRLDTCDVHPDVLHALTTYQPAKFFLPNLQRWTANDNTKGLLPFADAFVGPKLTHIIMEFIDSPPDTMGMSALLFSLAHLSVDLQSLEFGCNGNNHNFYDPLFDLVTHLPNLHRLVIPYIPSRVLAHLSRLPFLEVLSQVELEDEGDIPLFITQDGRFPSLKGLDISVPDYTTACALLKVLQRPLESVTLASGNHPADISTQSTLFTQTLSMLKQYHRFSLRKLVIYTPTNRVSASGQVTSDAFAPLYSFQSLRHLCLATPFSLHLDDAWLAHAIPFWPSLRVLKIAHRSTVQGLPGFTLEGLIPLMKGCPRLSELTLPLNLKPVAISSLEGASNWRIRYICITPGSITHPRRVFRSLITMFPNLLSLFLTGNIPHVRENGWQELLDPFRMFWPVDEEDE